MKFLCWLLGHKYGNKEFSINLSKGGENECVVVVKKCSRCGEVHYAFETNWNFFSPKDKLATPSTLRAISEAPLSEVKEVLNEKKSPSNKKVLKPANSDS